MNECVLRNFIGVVKLLITPSTFFSMLNLDLESSKWLCYMMGTWGGMKTQREGSISSWINNFIIIFRIDYLLSAAISWFSALNLTCIQIIFYQKRQPSCSPFNFWLEIHFLRYSPVSSPLPFSNLIPSTWPYWSLFQGFRIFMSTTLKTSGWNPKTKVWFRWFSRTKEVVFRSYVSFQGEYLQRFSTFKSEFTPLPNHQSPINAALTFAAPQQLWCFFFGVLLPAPAMKPRFFAQPSFWTELWRSIFVGFFVAKTWSMGW